MHTLMLFLSASIFLLSSSHRRGNPAAQIKLFWGTHMTNVTQNSGRKMMDWLEDTVIEIRQKQNIFSQQLEDGQND
jgi:hypothetical protein